MVEERTSGRLISCRSTHPLVAVQVRCPVPRAFTSFSAHSRCPATALSSGSNGHAMSSDYTDSGRADAESEGAIAVALRDAVLRQVADGVIFTDPEGRVVFVNDAALAIHGVAQLEVAVEDQTKTYHLLTIGGEPYPLEELPLARAVRRGESVVDAEWRIRRPDGTEVIAQGNASPVLDGEGRMLGAVLTLRDVTGRHHRRRRADAEDVLVRKIVREAPAMIAVLRGPQHVFEAANLLYMRLVGERRSILDKPVREALPELEGQGIYELLDGVHASGNPYHGTEVRLLLDRGNGSLDEAFFNFSYQPIFAAGGEVDGILVHAVDVTEQVQARQVIEEQAAELEQQAAELEQQMEEAQALAEELEVANEELQTANETAGVARDVAEQRAEELSRRAREAALMGAVGRALTQGGPLQQILCRCTDAVVEHLDAAFTRIWTLEEAGSMLVLQASSGLYTHLDGGHSRVPVGALKIGRIASEREPHLTNDVPNDPRVSDPAWARREGMVSFAGYPLLVQDRVVGVLALFARHPLPESALAALGTVADGIAVAIQRAHADEERERLLHRAEDAQAEAEKARTEAEEANLAKSQFLANMSHEIRTPINAIMGYADLLDADVAGPLTEGQRSYADRILSSGRHLIGLVNEILDLAKVEAGELVVAREPAPVSGTAEEAVSMITPQATAKGIAVVVEDEVSHPDAMYLGDPDRVRQILVNVLSNAVKFTEPGGRITLRCRMAEEAGDSAETQGDGPWLALEVEDTGIGIAPEQLGRVFDPFVQVDDKDTRREGGTGLGLTISRKFARLMGGDLTVASRPGEGSSFTLLLPMDTAEARARGHAASIQAASPVVVVAFGDDGEALGELERQVHPGVRLVGTTSVDEVVALARRENAMLVVLDISSESGAAWQIAHMLHEAPELIQTPVLLLPWIPTPGTEPPSDGLDLGWLSLVPKPFTSGQLTHAISVAVAGDEGQRVVEGGEDGCDVLIVDDDPDTRRIAGAFLKEANVKVREAVDGERALAEMRATPPDVLVLDLMMPVLDGFGVLAAMRVDPALARIPVVVLTAKSLTESERQFLARTAVRVLQKGSHRLADVAALVLRAASNAQRLSGGTTAVDRIPVVSE
jgi:PAS domain S-box-containing protein